ncbi:PREDICTED: fetuin-B-like isoform X2 [Condylura cristata]|uniref:fetuin-B-like isoform X2 n=1 Tax=Condylura cristata TaxID=143302 RepID=UPI000642DC41|nr:PREDICTED: fetuin-B-like isoform X2 [Condylura cristata]
MGLLLPLVLCALAVGSGATSSPQQVLNPSHLLSHDCNNSYVLSFADITLEHINKDRKDGYVLSLNRASDVREYREVYGQCKSLLYIHRTARILYTLSYNCTLRPVSRRRIQQLCPECPSPIDVSDPKVLEAATESLAKYNRESTLKQYSLVKVTRASSQWAFGPSYFVEYLIKEARCTKFQFSCIFQSPASEPVGLCKGSLSRNRIKTFVSVTCNFFESQGPAFGDENSAVDQGSAHLPKVEDSQQKKAGPTYAPPIATTGPKGSVQYLPDLDDDKSQSSRESFPVHLDLTTNPQGEDLDISFLFSVPWRETMMVLPFPSKEHRSAECPGPAKEPNPLVLPP